MKNNWPIKKLKEVADILMGQSPPSSTYNYKGEGLPFFQGKAEFGDIFPEINKYCSKPVRTAENGDILLSVRAPVGPINIAREKSCIGRGLSAIRAKNRIAIQWYLYYVLKQHEDNWSGATGSTFESISRQTIENLQVLVPSLNDQRKIVQRLDAIRKAQDLCDQQIQKTDELFESTLKTELNKFTKNEVKRLEEVADVTSSKRVFQKDYVQKGIPFYRTKEIVELSQNKPISLELYISEDQYSDIAEKFGIPKKGNILISAVGTIGISWIVSDDRRFYFKDGNLLWIKSFNGIEPQYLKFFFDYSFILVSKMASGGAYKALTIINLKKLKIPIPSISKQREIVKKLEAVQNYKKLLQKQKILFKELFDSVLDKSMKGELDS